MVAELRRAVARVGAELGLEASIAPVADFAAAEFDRGDIGLVRDAAAALGLPHRDIVSGAGHDAVFLARVATTAMVFVPCEGGISHNERERARPADLAAGCDVLLDVVLRRAVEVSNP